jgi:hypothetical protein
MPAFARRRPRRSGGFTYEKSHADATFSTKFEAPAKMCTDAKELGYDMLWQGAPDGD